MKSLLLILALTITSSCFAEPFTLYFVRHAEKDLSTKQDPDLTEEGRETAQRLADYLEHKELHKIYSTNYQRTLNTALPVVKAHRLQVTQYSPRELQTLAAQLISLKENALIVGHSNTTPEMVNLVGGEAKPMTEEEYGDLFMVTIDPDLATVKTVKIALK